LTRAELIEVSAPEFFGEAMGMLTSKGKAYSPDSDALDNFKRNAGKLGMQPFQVWSIYFSKHVDSIINAVRECPTIPHDASEGFHARLVDAAAYLALGVALYQESLEIKHVPCASVPLAWPMGGANVENDLDEAVLSAAKAFCYSQKIKNRA